MPSEEVMYLTTLSNSALTQQKLSLEQSLHAYTKKETILFHKTFAWTQKCTDLFSYTNVSNSGWPFIGTCCFSGHIII